MSNVPYGWHNCFAALPCDAQEIKQKVIWPPLYFEVLLQYVEDKVISYKMHGLNTDNLCNYLVFSKVLEFLK